ncbi:O-antigen ligase family protein [Oscillatoria sp. FACHB-1406]|nr:O-antigen ligase family protein [Oscillatoria sp. FACHB-1406]
MPWFSRAANPGQTLPWQLLQSGLLIFPLLPALGAVAIAIAILIVWKQQFRSIARSPVNRALGILSLLLILSACFANKPAEAFLGLANFLPFFIGFVAFSQLLRTPQQLHRIAWILAISTVPVVILGLGQMWGGWQSPQWVWAVAGWHLEPQGNPSGRMASTFMYANLLAAYLTFVFILGLGLAISTYENWRRSRQKGGQLLFLTLFLSGCLIALVLTSSRNAWGAIALCFLAFILYRGWYWLGLAAGTAAGSVLWASFGPSWGRKPLRNVVPDFFWRRLSGEMYAPPPLPALRASQWQFAGEMARARPLLGWGLRNFTPLYEAKTQFWFGHPHNLYLMLAAETGIPTLLLFCAIAGWILARAVLCLQQWQTERFLLFSYILAFSSLMLLNGLDVTIFDPRLNTYGWLLLGALCGAGSSSSLAARDVENA